MSAHDALRTILPVAGLSEERARAVTITGNPDPILPDVSVLLSNFRGSKPQRNQN